MNRIPIVFAFDNNLAMPAAVCIYSLLSNASENTVYRVYILHSKSVVLDDTLLKKVFDAFPRHGYELIAVPDSFEQSYVIRGISVATYYRLFIPELFPKYDKAIYADVDMIFQSDLTGYFDTDLTGKYVAASYDWGMLFNHDGQRHIKELNLPDNSTYLQAGFLVMNMKKMREDSIQEKFFEKAQIKYTFQDQDILNVVCGKSHVLLPFEANLTDYAMYFYNNDKTLLEKHYPKISNNIIKYGTLHFNGHKPWKKYSVNFDIWWEYYRRSPIFDEKFYFDFFYRKLDELDTLTLWKRIKVLARYFTVGKK